MGQAFLDLRPEWRKALILPLYASKCLALTQDKPMGHLVVLVRHLWISDKEKVQLLDVPLSPMGLFRPPSAAPLRTSLLE